MYFINIYFLKNHKPNFNYSRSLRIKVTQRTSSWFGQNLYEPIPDSPIHLYDDFLLFVTSLLHFFTSSSPSWVYCMHFSVVSFFFFSAVNRPFSILCWPRIQNFRVLSIRGMEILLFTSGCRCGCSVVEAFASRGLCFLSKFYLSWKFNFIDVGKLHHFYFVTTDPAEFSELLTKTITDAHSRTCLVPTVEIQQQFRRPHDITRLIYYKNMEHHQIWLECAQKLTSLIQQIIEFAKMVPGFMKLTQDDQITLLKAG